MLKLIVQLFTISLLTASPKSLPESSRKKPAGFEDVELTEIVTSEFTTTEDLASTYIEEYPGRYQRLHEYGSLCGLDTFGKGLTLRFSNYREISEDCCDLIRETACLFTRIEFHGIANIISGDKCIPKGIQNIQPFIKC